jgi:hypothetical protein
MCRSQRKAEQDGVWDLSEAAARPAAKTSHHTVVPNLASNTRVRAERSGVGRSSSSSDKATGTRRSGAGRLLSYPAPERPGRARRRHGPGRRRTRREPRPNRPMRRLQTGHGLGTTKGTGARTPSSPATGLKIWSDGTVAGISLHLRSAQRLAMRDGTEQVGTTGDGRGCPPAVCARHQR